MRIDTTGFPMMSEKEVGIIWKLFDLYKPEECLEWGSGNSTIYFPVHHAIKHWLSIEDNGHYVNYLKDKIDKEKVDLVWKHEDYAGYVDFPTTYGVRFDFILIDGVLRPDCARAAHRIAKPETIILLHDASREESKQILDEWPGEVEILIEGEKKLSNGFCAHRGLAHLKI